MALNYILLGKRIKSLRCRRHLTQAVFSEMIDKTPNYVCCIESGIKGPSLDTLILIANALGVTTDVLLAESLDNYLKVDESEYIEIFQDCTPYERRILIENARSLKSSMREYHFLSGRKQ